MFYLPFFANQNIKQKNKHFYKRLKEKEKKTNAQ